MKCKKCGKENWDDANFCEYCGAPLSHDEILSQPTTNKNSQNKMIVISLVLVLGLAIIAIIGTSTKNDSSIKSSIGERETEETIDYTDNNDDNIDEEYEEYTVEDDEEEYIPEYVEYRTQYNMLTRSSGDYDAEELGHIDEYKIIKIYDTIQNPERHSTWGKMENGEWICLRDDDYEYCTRY